MLYNIEQFFLPNLVLSSCYSNGLAKQSLFKISYYVLVHISIFCFLISKNFSWAKKIRYFDILLNLIFDINLTLPMGPFFKISDTFNQELSKNFLKNDLLFKSYNSFN